MQHWRSEPASGRAGDRRSRGCRPLPRRPGAARHSELSDPRGAGAHERTEAAFWNPRLHWYDWRLVEDRPAEAVRPRSGRSSRSSSLRTPSRSPRRRLRTRRPSRRWARAPEATSTRTPARRRSSRIRGSPTRSAHVYFDDNGWFEIAFLDAYQATRRPALPPRRRDVRTRFIAERRLGLGRRRLLVGDPPPSPHLRAPRRRDRTPACASTRSRGDGESYLYDSSELWLAWVERSTPGTASEHLYQRNPTDGDDDGLRRVADDRRPARAVQDPARSGTVRRGRAASRPWEPRLSFGTDLVLGRPSPTRSTCGSCSSSTRPITTPGGSGSRKRNAGTHVLCGTLATPTGCSSSGWNGGRVPLRGCSSRTPRRSVSSPGSAAFTRQLAHD